jgi:hypothetical protein
VYVAICVATPTLGMADCTATHPNEMKRCIAEYLISTNIVIQCTYADPGGAKLKSSKDSCDLDCNLDESAFVSKWVGPQECVDTEPSLTPTD